jgi:hypothetical protein
MEKINCFFSFKEKLKPIPSVIIEPPLQQACQTDGPFACFVRPE